MAAVLAGERRVWAIEEAGADRKLHLAGTTAMEGGPPKARVGRMPARHREAGSFEPQVGFSRDETIAEAGFRAHARHATATFEDLPESRIAMATIAVPTPPMQTAAPRSRACPAPICGPRRERSAPTPSAL